MVTQPYIVEQVLCGIKTETSYGVTASLAAATDYMYVESLDLKIDHKQVERNYKHNQLNALQDAPGNTLYNITFETEYQTSGSAGKVLPAYSALEQACGMYESSSASNVVYLLQHTASANFPSPGKSATIVCYYRDKQFTLTGVYGNIEETHKADGIVKVKFTGMGLYNTESVAASIPAPTFKETYIHVASASMSTHGYDPEFSEITINYGNEVKSVPFAGTPYGTSKIMITNRKPTVKVKTLMDSKSGHDFIGKRVSKATGAITYTAGSGTGNVMSYSFPTTQYREVNITEQDGVFAYDVTANVVGDFTKTIS